MPGMPQINPDIRPGGSIDPGWTNVKAGSGRGTAPFQLVTDNRNQISGVNFLNDTRNQPSWHGSSTRAVSSVDANAQVENAEYTVIVGDMQNGDALIDCDRCKRACGATRAGAIAGSRRPKRVS